METKEILTLAVSLLALGTSVLSLTVTFRQRAQENKRGVRKALTDTLGELAGVNLAFAKLDADHPEQTDQIVNLRRTYNSQRRYLANHAEYLIFQIPELAADIDYQMLAGAFHGVGDYDKVQIYWEKCVAASESPVLRAMNLRGFGRFLFFQGNPALGRKKYNEALELPLPDTDNVRRDRTDTYTMWARVELDFGFRGEATRLREQARAAASRIGHAGMRTSIEAYIENVLAALDDEKSQDSEAPHKPTLA